MPPPPARHRYSVGVPAHSAELYPGDIKSVLLSEEQIQSKTAELGALIAADYRDAAAEQDLLLVTVLKGAVMFVTDLARAIPLPTQLEFMAVSSYGSSTSSSGVVRILKDLDRDINDRDVLIVEDIVDSGLTLSWLLRNLATSVRGHCGCARCCASSRPSGPMSRSSTSASTSPTSSSSGTGSTTPSVTATCPTSARSTPRCTRTTKPKADKRPSGRRPTNGRCPGGQNAGMTETALRICPFCEATCGLTLTIDDGRVTGARGDHDDVFSAGFICPKGASFAELDNDPPDRWVRH